MSIVDTRLDQVFFFALPIEARPLEARLERNPSVGPDESGPDKSEPDESEPEGAAESLSTDRILNVLKTRFSNRKIQWGLLNGKTTAIVRTGAGKENARKAARAFLRQTIPSIVWSVGFAGALDETIKKQQILTDLIPLLRPQSSLVDILPEKVLIYEPDPNGAPLRPTGTANGPAPRFIITTDRIIARSEEKAELFRTTGAAVVDMETDAIAQVCEEFGVPLKCVRIISDAASDELPPDLERLMEQKSFMGQMGAAIGSLWKKPGRIVDLFALKANALESAEKLAAYLAEQ